MNSINPSLSLIEIQKLLEHNIKNNRDNIRMISNLNLTEEDYLCLKQKITEKMRHDINNVKLWERYALSIMVLLIFALRFEDEETTYIDEIEYRMRHIRQYKIRYILEILMDTIEKNKIETFNMNEVSVDEFVKLVRIHSGMDLTKS